LAEESKTTRSFATGAALPTQLAAVAKYLLAPPPLHRLVAGNADSAKSNITAAISDVRRLPTPGDSPMFRFFCILLVFWGKGAEKA
jgi:hypothetical protein